MIQRSDRNGDYHGRTQNPVSDSIYLMEVSWG